MGSVAVTRIKDPILLVGCTVSAGMSCVACGAQPDTVNKTVNINNKDRQIFISDLSIAGLRPASCCPG
jgi:hypothetical protein